MAERGLTLYDILPLYVRQQDTNNHTRRFLDASDELLDRVYKTLEQYYADNFPDLPLDANELAGQDWLLPYFADLLDVRLVSPLLDGKREEVTNAVRWRQRKGTLRVVDEVAEGVGQWEAVVQEGWRRVATTPRLDEPLLPEEFFGLDTTLPRTIPSAMAKHPGLPAVTPDFRIGSRAVVDADNHPNSQVSTVRGQSIRWRQQYAHGVPCHHEGFDASGNFHAGAFDDVSRRTPDLRSSDWRVGHFHPRKILLHVVQPEGFFTTGRAVVQWKQQWLDNDETPSDAFLEQVTLYSQLDHTLGDHTLVIANRALFENTVRAFTPIEMRGVLKLGQVPQTGVGSPDAGAYRLVGLVLPNRVEVDSGTLALDRCAAAHVEVHSKFGSSDPRHLVVPVFSARDSLLRSMATATSLTRLEYCTVLKKCIAEALQASDCIFTCLIRRDYPTQPPPQKMCVRYSRVEPAQEPDTLDTHFHNTRAPLWFFANDFGDSGCGVIHPATSEAIRHGAEDGTEVGAYHFLQLSLRFEAVATKLADYLSVGFEAVVIPDSYLGRLPEQLQN